jgi:gas vesicle protein
MAKDDSGNTILWFLTGAAVGAAIALLYAPASGREARKFIRKKAEEGRETLDDAGKEIVDRGRDYYKKGLKIAEEAGDLLERGKKLVTG